MNKSTIRSVILKKRNQLSFDQISTASEKIVAGILGSSLYQQANHVALYLPFGGEVDLTALLAQTNKHHYLPSIKGQSMQFQKHTDSLHLKLHHYGISQPEFIDALPAAQLDLCLMPLLAFDTAGNRLGMGGGFYDRYFEHLNHSRHIEHSYLSQNHTALAGVAYQFQQQNTLPTNSWDVKINHLFTEQGYLKL